MGRIKQHWPKLLAALAFLPPFVKFLSWLLGQFGSADFIISRIDDPDWVGVMLNLLIDPPPASLVPLIVLGLALIYWDGRRKHAGRFAPSAPVIIDHDREAIAIKGDDRPQLLQLHLFIQNNSKSETLRGVELVLEEVSSIDGKLRKPIGRTLLADVGRNERFDLAPEQKRRVVLLTTSISHLLNDKKHDKYKGLIAWGPFKGDPSIEDTARGIWFAKLCAYGEGMAPHREVFAVDACGDVPIIGRNLGDPEKL